jgi:hypothetical protein
MAKVSLVKDEWYPVYFPHGVGDYEVPDELIKRWKIVNNEFDEVQMELERIYNEGKEFPFSSDVTLK